MPAMNRILVLLLSLLSFTVLANDALYRVQVPAQGVPLLDAQRQALGQVITRLSGRITSYNVCYTKLLRAVRSGGCSPGR